MKLIGTPKIWSGRHRTGLTYHCSSHWTMQMISSQRQFINRLVQLDLQLRKIFIWWKYITHGIHNTINIMYKYKFRLDVVGSAIVRARALLHIACQYVFQSVKRKKSILSSTYNKNSISDWKYVYTENRFVKFQMFERHYKIIQY